MPTKNQTIQQNWPFQLEEATKPCGNLRHNKQKFALQDPPDFIGTNPSPAVPLLWKWPLFWCLRFSGWCSTPTQVLICSSFNRENGHPLLICSSLSRAQFFLSSAKSYIQPSWHRPLLVSPARFCGLEIGGHDYWDVLLVLRINGL